MLVSPRHTLTVVGAGLVLALPMVLFQRWAYARGMATAKAFRNLYDVLIARMNGLKLAKAFAIEKQLEVDFATSADALRKAEIAISGKCARATLVQDLTAALMLVSSGLCGARLSHDRQHRTGRVDHDLRAAGALGIGNPVESSGPRRA